MAGLSGGGHRMRNFHTASAITAARPSAYPMVRALPTCSWPCMFLTYVGGSYCGKSVAGYLGAAGLIRRGLLLRQHFLGGLVPCGPQLHKRLGFLIETLALFTVKDSFANDAEDGLGAEVIFVVKLVDHFQNVLARQAGILDLRYLVSAFVNHFFSAKYESILLGVVIQLSTWISMSDTYLDSFNIKFLSKIYSSADRFATFTRQ